MANEVAGYLRFADDLEGFAKLMGMDPTDPEIKAHLDELRTTTAAFRTFVGDEAFLEFTKISEMRGPVPPEFL